MGWNKKTRIESKVDGMIQVLDANKIPYTLSTIMKVHDWSFNAAHSGIDLPLRKLQYSDKVVLERIERSNDCDCDDVVVSCEFPLVDEPSNWECVQLDDEDE